MEKEKIEEIRDSWNKLADDWEIHIGKDGDSNRRLNSDPVLWDFAGDVTDLFILDAGCGTGYLSRKLWEKGAKVTGLDLSGKMIEIAKKNNPQIDFFAGSCSDMPDLKPDYFDLIIANYVLMDLPELEQTIDSFYRVLKPKGKVILIFSHPCFPQGKAALYEENDNVSYHWDYPYFSQTKITEPPWGRFKNDFIWFHRPLSDYFKAFKNSGFTVTDFEEPRLTPERYHLAKNPNTVKYSLSRPYSIAFKLQK